MRLWPAKAFSCRPKVIRQIDDNQGNKLQTYTQKRKVVFPSEPVLQLTDILQDVVNKGTGTQARLNKIAVAGKTGTADKARDIWFVGFTPDTVTAVWGGNDEYSAVRGNVTGGTVMGKIWHDYMTDFYKTHDPPTKGFDQPAVPFAKKTSAINANVLKDIEDTEAGLKPTQEQLAPTGEQPAADGDSPDAESMPQPAPARTEQTAPGEQPAPAPDHPNTELAPIHTEQPRESEPHHEEPTTHAPEGQQEMPPRAPEIHQPLPEPAPSIPRTEQAPAPATDNQ